MRFISCWAPQHGFSLFTISCNIWNPSVMIAAVFYLPYGHTLVWLAPCFLVMQLQTTVCVWGWKHCRWNTKKICAEPSNVWQLVKRAMFRRIKIEWLGETLVKPVYVHWSLRRVLELIMFSQPAPKLQRPCSQTIAAWVWWSHASCWRQWTTLQHSNTCTSAFVW